MHADQLNEIDQIVAQFGRDRSRLVPIVQAVQRAFGHVSDDAIDRLASQLSIHRVQVADTVSFYAFLNREPQGRCQIRLSKTPISFMNGAVDVAEAFEQELGIRIGQTTADGDFSLSWTSDIGLADQEPAALVNEVPLVRLDVRDVPLIVATLRAELTGQPAAPLPYRTISSSIVQRGSVLLALDNRESQSCSEGVAPQECQTLEAHVPTDTAVQRDAEAGLRSALRLSPEEVTSEISKSRLRGRGGAGFPTGLKWKNCRQATGVTRFVICNADEGEPGTFKDRVLLTEFPDRVFAGMTIAGFALGASEGIVYLRAEYAYLWDHLQRVLEQRRAGGLLGKSICGRTGFDFDIRIQMGAGAYICGEESALIESLEGKRGAPRDRPPFPTEHGFQQQPTSVNNVETLACVARIMELGADWFSQFGTRQSAGTKLLSVSGDCERPGVYEVPFGLTINDMLDLVGGGDAEAVQVGGPSGQCIGPKDFGRQICFEDLPTGGSMMVFGSQRDLLSIVRQFMEFFAEESCGWCVPCRVGTNVLGTMIDKVLAGRGTERDLQEIERLSGTVMRTSRCGLGQTAPNPILSTLRNFPHLWEARLRHADFVPLFELEKSLQTAVTVQGRPTHGGSHD